MSILKQAFPIIALISILTFVYTKNFFSVHTVDGNFCRLQSDHCFLETAAGKVEISVDKYPVVVEEEINVSILLPDGFQLVEQKVVGVNMYMGEIPVIIENRDIEYLKGLFQGIFFLGSCSKPEMIWQLQLVARNKESDINERIHVEFVTTQ